MANFAPLTAEISLPVSGIPANFSVFRIFSSLLQRRRSPDANQTLHNVWPSPGRVHYIYIFQGSCPLTKFCPFHNLLYVQVLCSPILAEILHGTPAVGVSQTLRRGTRNGITELLHRAPPIFSWAAITLGIGPHYSYRQHCAKCNAPVFNLLGGRFWGFSPLRGNALHWWGWNLAWRSPPPCHISPPSVQRLGYRTPKTEIFLLRFDQNVEYKRPAGVYPLHDFHKFAEFVPRFRMR